MLLVGKLTISMAIFNSELLNYQRVNLVWENIFGGEDTFLCFKYHGICNSKVTVDYPEKKKSWASKIGHVLNTNTRTVLAWSLTDVAIRPATPRHTAQGWFPPDFWSPKGAVGHGSGSMCTALGVWVKYGQVMPELSWKRE